MAPCAPNAQRQSTTLTGFLTVHVVCSNVELEIPPAIFGRSILLYTMTGTRTHIQNPAMRSIIQNDAAVPIA